ncbi:SIS domain-containing protein [Desulfococcaceae bacterium HSG8]|nr:SIS domain-containing protein [Desulfococcaceae bacterium HSG8]
MCGLAGIVSIKRKNTTDSHVDMASLGDMVIKTREYNFASCQKNDLSPEEYYLGGKKLLDKLGDAVTSLKKDDIFVEIFRSGQIQDDILKISDQLSAIIEEETKMLSDNMGRLSSGDVDIISGNIEILKDTAWCLTREITENIRKTAQLITDNGQRAFDEAHAGATDNGQLTIFKNINAVLNSIDRLEVRGRDSAGISLMFILNGSEFEKFRKKLSEYGLSEQLQERSEKDVLVNRSISINNTAITFTYKIAAEIGSLGDNVSFLREQIRSDDILHMVVDFPHEYHTVLSHTRWASVGAISEPNCHPLDNKVAGDSSGNRGIIHVCLNGDIDNYLELKKACENGNPIPEDITTDTKIIPLQVEKYIRQGADAEEAFRLAVNDFEGSHAISMHTDLAPGKLFLAQRGSGQAIFVGLGNHHYMPASEVYGFVEETSSYLKVDGEKTIEGKSGATQGQIFVLSQDAGGPDGIRAMYYDGTPITFKKEDIKHTEITSRDIDRQGFPHYFLKEISEAPASVEKTLQNRWKIPEGETSNFKLQTSNFVISLDEKVFPKSLETHLIEGKIRRIFFVGQGTAGVAAQGCADILNYYMNDPSLLIRSLKASELSGFTLNEHDDADAMKDSLVIAISQSGTTTDTNRTVDMVRERGAHTLAIVNRRDSDITFKVDGVMYTSSGRDIEMSVASTKAFYSQIVAGAILGLHMARLKGARSDAFVTGEIRALQELPGHMRKILSLCDRIEESAKRIATTRAYWAAVGSGPNKTSADEIRIKLSELCYKTISSDYVEDKKHIDLSSEPLIIVCAAGTRETVMGDIIKDTAIFSAHKALPVIIANEGENRFDPYAEDVFHVPAVSEHLAPIVNTLVGHLWGYYAALSINGGSRFLYDFREELRADIDSYAEKGLDVYELVLENPFREKIARFYNEFKKKKSENRLPSSMGFVASSDLTLLLKYLSGRLPVADFEIDFSRKGTALTMLNLLFECLGRSVNGMARPVDAIKHQAKTVTVGTSRISEKAEEGILFDTLDAQGFKTSQITPPNIIVLRNLQGIISGVQGITLYQVRGLNVLGEYTDETRIEVVRQEGTSAGIQSRVKKDNILKGTKKIIVKEGNVYIGKGRKDERSILVIPFISSPSMVEYLLLLDVTFKENVPLPVKIKALGGKYERIKNFAHENNIAWEDRLLERVAISELFGISAERIVEKIGKFIGSVLPPDMDYDRRDHDYRIHPS